MIETIFFKRTVHTHFGNENAGIHFQHDNHAVAVGKRRVRPGVYAALLKLDLSVEAKRPGGAVIDGKQIAFRFNPDGHVRRRDIHVAIDKHEVETVGLIEAADEVFNGVGDSVCAIAVIGDAPADFKPVAGAADPAAFGFFFERCVYVPIVQRFIFAFIAGNGQAVYVQIPRIPDGDIALRTFGKASAPGLRHKRGTVAVEHHVDINVRNPVGCEGARRKQQTERKRERDGRKTTFHLGASPL